NTSGATFRMDHCYVNNPNGTMCPDTVIGVIDHNQFSIRTPGISARDSRWNGDADGKGDLSWASPTNFGSSQFLFIEDNTASVANPESLVEKGITDAVGGARFVVRYNVLTNVSVQTHGTESSGRVRGVRADEIYGNTFISTFAPAGLGGQRSG